MSILLHKEIVDNYNDEQIHIYPFLEDNVGPNSYDVTLSNILKIYVSGTDEKEFILDCKKKQPTRTIVIPDEGLVLRPGVLYLGSTVEEIGSDHFIPMYEGISSLARFGVYTHVAAGYGDIGFKQKWTTEIQVIHPFKIYPGIRIGQVYFHTVNSEANLPENRYHGKYVNQNGPQESKSHLDFQ